MHRLDWRTFAVKPIDERQEVAHINVSAFVFLKTEK